MTKELHNLHLCAFGHKDEAVLDPHKPTAPGPPWTSKASPSVLTTSDLIAPRSSTGSVVARGISSELGVASVELPMGTGSEGEEEGGDLPKHT